MSNNFWNIGFQVYSAKEFKSLAALVLERGEVVEHKGEFQYVCWTNGNAELWLLARVDPQTSARKIVDLSTHYSGKTRTDLKLYRRVVREEASLLSTGYVAYSNSDSCPIVFDVPVTHEEQSLPCLAKVQITAFAQRIEVFASELEQDERRAVEGGWASRALVPCGTFRPNGEKIEPPDSMAIIAGVVTETESFVNPHTGHSYQWAVINSYLYDYDVVVGPDICKQPLAIDNVIVGTFWLSAKLHSLDGIECV